MANKLYNILKSCLKGEETDSLIRSVKEIFDNTKDPVYNLTYYLEYKDYNQRKYEFLDLEVCKMWGYTPPYIFSLLSLAVEKQLYKTVKLMIDAGLNVNTVEDTGKTPLITAINNNDNKMVEYLLDVGANPNAGNYHHSPLVLMIFSNNYYLVKLLLEKGADQNKLESMGRLPLDFAVLQRNMDIIKLLIEYKTYLDNSKYTYHNHISSILINFPECLPYMIRNGLDVNRLNSLGETMLEHLISSIRLKDVRTLIQFGAKVTVKERDALTRILKSNINFTAKRQKNYSKIKHILESWLAIYTLHTLTLRMILIHDVDVTDVPKSVLNIEL